MDSTRIKDKIFIISFICIFLIMYAFASETLFEDINASGYLTAGTSVTASNFVQSAGSAGGYVGNGSGLTNLNASSFGSGTLPVTRGGTGLGSISTTNMLFASGPNTLSQTPFYIAGQQTYAGTITWTAGTAPSGALNQTYYWQRVGRNVFLSINLNYAVAGATCTIVNMTLPSDCPAPLEMTGLGAASTHLYSGSGWLDTALTGSPPSCRAWIRKNAANNGYECLIIAASQSAICAKFEIMYPAAN